MPSAPQAPFGNALRRRVESRAKQRGVPTPVGSRVSKFQPMSSGRPVKVGSRPAIKDSPFPARPSADRFRLALQRRMQSKGSRPFPMPKKTK